MSSKLIVLAVRDSAVRAFNRPFYAPTLEAGIRSFYDECKRQADDNPMWKHPDDFELWQLGVFDDESGVFEDQSPRLVARAKDTQG